MRKLLRTLQVQFPYLLEAKFKLMRSIRNAMEIPFSKEFRGLSVFPNLDDALYVDVGANRGQSTDAILLMKRKNIRIHLFEPNIVLSDKLKGLFGNNERVLVHNFGLGDEAMQGVLFIPFYKNWMFDGLASFDESHARDWLRGRVFFYSDRFFALQRSRCELRRLDELELAPFLIKFSIQGYEYSALRGGEKTIKTHEPVLLIQSVDDRTIDYLKGLGYRPYGFRKGKFIPDVTDSYFTYFMTEKKLSLVRAHLDKQS